jgi:predicted nucleotidyltransferase
LAVFGSGQSDRFRQDSEFEAVAPFLPDAKVSHWDWVTMRDDLSDTVGRPVDLAEKRSLKPLIWDVVLAHSEVLFAA